MLPQEESPRKPQYNMATPISRQSPPSTPPPFCLNPPAFFEQKFSDPIFLPLGVIAGVKSSYKKENYSPENKKCVRVFIVGTLIVGTS